MKIEHIDESFEIDAKRFHVPIVVRATCPKCGRECENDYRDTGMTYPKVNRPETIGFVCYTEIDGEGVHHDFEKTIIVRVTFEEVQEGSNAAQ